MTERSQMVHSGKILRAAGLSPGTTGNLSVRVGDHFLCTPTGGDLGALDATLLSEVDLDGTHVSGPRPTKESAMHAAFYRGSPSTMAIVHLHSTYATAVSCLTDVDEDDVIPPLTPYLSMRAGRVARVPYMRPGSADLGVNIGELVARGSRALLLANHGSIVGGTSLDDAVSIAQELEESARLHLLLHGHRVNVISEADRLSLFG